MNMTTALRPWRDAWILFRGLLALRVIGWAMWLFHDEDREGLAMAAYAVGQHALSVHSVSTRYTFESTGRPAKTGKQFPDVDGDV